MVPLARHRNCHQPSLFSRRTASGHKTHALRCSSHHHTNFYVAIDRVNITRVYVRSLSIYVRVRFTRTATILPAKWVSCHIRKQTKSGCNHWCFRLLKYSVQIHFKRNYLSMGVNPLNVKIVSANCSCSAKFVFSSKKSVGYVRAQKCL